MIILLGMLLPPAEILLISWVAAHYGWPLVVLACVIGIITGRSLLRWRGKVFLQEAQAAVQQDRLPTDAIIGGMAWYVAGILFIIPGFITDLLGLLILLPPVRRRLLTRFGQAAEARLFTVGPDGFQQGGFGQGGFGQGGFRPGGNVYEGEARRVDEETPRLPPEDHSG